MPTTRFQLESVLKIRSAERDSQRVALADVDKVLHSLDQRVAAIHRELDILRADASAAVRQPSLEIVDIAAANRHQADLRRELRTLTLRRSQVLESAEQARAALTAADGRVRSLERLRDRRDEDQRNAIQRREMRQGHERLARSC